MSACTGSQAAVLATVCRLSTEIRNKAFMSHLAGARGHAKVPAGREKAGHLEHFVHVPLQDRSVGHEPREGILVG
jgi:hypothetical protein